MFERLKRYARYRQTYKELSRLSDRDLKDLGINRSDIKAISRDSYY